MLHRASATGCRAGRARWTPSTPPSCTAAPTSPRTSEPGTLRLLPVPRPRAASSASSTREFGTAYGAYRPAEEDTLLLAHRPRASSPSTPCRPPARWARTSSMSAYVPMDDDHTLQWEVFYRTDGPARPQRVVPINRHVRAAGQRPRRQATCRNGTGWYDRFDPGRRTCDNDYLIDREAQANWEQLHRHPRHPPAGHGRHREHGPDLRPHARAPRHDRRDDHPHAPPLIAAAKALREQGIAAARRRQPGGLPPALRRGHPAAQRRLVGRHKALREIFEVDEIPAEFTTAGATK